MVTPKGAMLGWLTRYAARLRFPTLFAIVAAVFILDLLIPDFIPFADEVLLGLLTVLLGSLRAKNRGRHPEAEPAGEIVDVDPLGPPPDDPQRN